MSSVTQITTEKNEIKSWAQERDGKPAVVEPTDKDGSAMIRIKFTEEEDLKAVDWDRFFSIFDENNLAMIYQEETSSGEKSRFNKFVDKDSDEAREI